MQCAGCLRDHDIVLRCSSSRTHTLLCFSCYLKMWREYRADNNARIELGRYASTFPEGRRESSYYLGGYQ